MSQYDNGHFALKIQKARKEREAEDGPLASDEVVRYSCAEKYNMGAFNTPPKGCAAGPEATEEDDKISLARLLPKLPRFEAPERFQPGMIETFSGDTYYFDNPDPTHIHLADIAHALSNHCRYAGHTRRFYSVGEHSLLVRNILKAQGRTPFTQLIGLFHDAHEAYVMDAPRPLKPLLGEAFAAVADKADVAIADWFGNQGIRMYPRFFHQNTIKQADNMALVYERKQLMSAGPERWETGFEHVPDLPAELLSPSLGWWKPEIIENRFIEAAHELGVSE